MMTLSALSPPSSSSSPSPSPSPPALPPSFRLPASIAASSSIPHRFPFLASKPVFPGCTKWYSEVSASNGRGPRLLHSAFPNSPALISSVDGLFEFICMGPLMTKLGFTAEKVAQGIDRWLQCGGYLCRLFQMNEFSLTFSDKARVYHYYIPVFLWCEDQILRHKSMFNEGDEIPPLVIGVSAPQGSGKTTLVFALDYLFQRTGWNSATLSIDDFYLTAEDQAKLRSQNPGNALLELRGNAGSHDLPFSVDTLTALMKLTNEGTKVKLPRYDKSAYQGRGDRADPSTWPEIKGPLDVVLFEGWMLGFKPLPSEVVKAVDSQAEVAMKADGKPGMSDEEVLDFVSRYLPAYKAYLPALYSEGPRGSDPDRLLVIEIDGERNPIA